MKASENQKRFIRRLLRETGKNYPGNLDELEAAQASQLIDSLKAGDIKNSGAETAHKEECRHPVGINEPRLGLATKETYRRWLQQNRDILEQEEAFIREALRTYRVFSEIGKRAGESGK